MLINSLVLTTGLLIFFARVVDVSLGTMRTLSTIQGKTQLAFLLGLTEMGIWLFVISTVIKSIPENPVLGLFYTLGFATGNVVGIIVERKIAFGHVNLRIISSSNGNILASKVRQLGYAVTCFKGRGVSGPVTELYILCRRRDLQEIVNCVQNVEPNVFFVTESVGIMRQGNNKFLSNKLRLKANIRKK
jgi:uncharacterized protein YebE (UPF0316 family)